MDGGESLQVVGDAQPTSGVDMDELKTVIDDAVRAGSDATNAKYDALERQIIVLGDSVAMLSSSNDSDEDGADSVYLVRLAPEQVDRAMAGFRVLCTEGLLLMALVGALCGLFGWFIFSGRWGGYRG